MTATHLIVWDLDLTLGDFSALHRQEGNVGPVSLRVRPGLAESLRALSAAGFAHTVLTLASPLYAEMALRGTGLREFFVRVEGMGQRDKGDAAGVAGALGIPEAEWPDRVLFVGDHPLFDPPRDPRILFHLEPFALSRPAADLERLVLHLRAEGNGSLRGGFDRLAARRVGWRRFCPWRFRPPLDRPLRRCPAGVGDLLLLRCAERCPVIGFEKRPAPGTPAPAYSLVPAEMIARIQAEDEGKARAESAKRRTDVEARRALDGEGLGPWMATGWQPPEP